MTGFTLTIGLFITSLCAGLPTDAASKDTSISQKMCLEYSNLTRSPVILSTDNSERPNLQGDIDRCAISGKSTESGDATVGEVPHMAQIGYERDGEAEIVCGGSLISDEYVITAGYCVRNTAKNSTTFFVRLGGLHVNNQTGDLATQRIPIAEAILYPKYVPGEIYHDIALLRLEYKVKFSWYIRPICLHTGEPVDKLPLVASGWGVDPKTYNRIEILRKVKLIETPYEVCKVPYEIKKQFNKVINYEIDNETMICATHPLGHDSLCQGDGGGPLYFKPEEPYCTYKLVGIVGFGGGCKTVQEVPSVFTRIAAYIQWIEAIVWKQMK